MSAADPNTGKQVMDVVSVLAALGSWMQVLTPLFGLIGATWTVMRITEMVTGKSFHELIARKPKAPDA